LQPLLDRKSTGRCKRRGENGGIIEDDNNTILYKSNSHIDTIVFQHPIRDKMQDASS